MKISTTTTFILLGLGALAIYKFNQMSAEEKTALKEKGKNIFEEHISPLLVSALGIAGPKEALEQTEGSIK